MDTIQKQNTSVSTDKKPVERELLESFEDVLKNTEGSFVGDSVVCPLNHSFSPGIYVREITIPKDTLLVGKIHKHKHPNFLLKGEVVMVTENGGEETLTAPCSMISEPGTKRALYAKSEVVWTTIHLNPTDTKDLEKLEKEIIAKDFEEFDKYILSQGNFKNRIKKLLIKNLIK